MWAVKPSFKPNKPFNIIPIFRKGIPYKTESFEQNLNADRIDVVRISGFIPIVIGKHL